MAPLLCKRGFVVIKVNIGQLTACCGLCLLALYAWATEEWMTMIAAIRSWPVWLDTIILLEFAPNAVLIILADKIPSCVRTGGSGCAPVYKSDKLELLLGTDWYINSIALKVNQSDPIDVLWTRIRLMGSKETRYFYRMLRAQRLIRHSWWTSIWWWRLCGSDDPTRMAQTVTSISYFSW